MPFFCFPCVARQHEEVGAAQPGEWVRHEARQAQAIGQTQRLRAVLEPAQSEYLYFVSRNDGTHHFSRSYREHVNAVNRYQRRRSTP